MRCAGPAGQAQLPYFESLAMACFAELPLAALLGWTAWRALELAAPLAASSSVLCRTHEQPTNAKGQISDQPSARAEIAVNLRPA